jgi:hypothetical protein
MAPNPQQIFYSTIVLSAALKLKYKLFELATLWEYLPLERRKPIEIKSVARRTREQVAPSPDQFPRSRSSPAGVIGQGYNRRSR